MDTPTPPPSPVSMPPADPPGAPGAFDSKVVEAAAEVDWQALDAARRARAEHPPGSVLIAGAAVALGGALALGLGAWLLLSAAAPRGERSRSLPAGQAAAAGTGASDRPALPTVARPGAGAHELGGLVVDTSGAPVAAAVVTARFEFGPSLELAPTEGLELAAEVVAISDGDGVFRLVGLEEGNYRLLVEAPGIFTSEVRLVEVPGADARIVVARRVSIDGTVVAPLGQPGGVPVVLRGDAIVGERVVVSGARGEFSFADLPEGRYQVRAGEGERAAPSLRVERLGVGPFASIELFLGVGHVLRGRVVEKGRDLGVAAAVALHATDSGEPSRFVRTSADGRFEFDALLAGRYQVVAHAPGFTSLEALEVRPERGTSPTVELIRGGVVEGRVVDASGVPVIGAEVVLFGTTKEGLSVERGAAIDRETLRVASGMGTQVITAAAPDEGELTATGNVFVPRGELGVLRGPIPPLPPPGSAATRIARIVGDELVGGQSPLAFVDVRGAGALPDLAALPELTSSYRTDGEGRFRVAGLQSGTYRVRAQANGFAPGESRPFVSSLGLTIDAVEIVLSRGVHLVGKVSDQHGEPVAGARVTVLVGTAGGAAVRLETIAEPTGEYRIGPVSGKITVVASAAGHAETTVERTLVNDSSLSSEETLDLVIAAADQHLGGRVSDQDRFAVAGATISLIVPQTGGAGRPRTTTTSATGDFGFERLPEGRYELEIRAAGFPPTAVEATTQDAAHEIMLRFGGGIELVVRDAHTLAPVVGASVAATGPAPRDAIDRLTAESGTAALGPIAAGEWNLRISQQGYVPARRRLEVPAGRRAGEFTVRDLVVEIERGATVAGTVRDAYGQRVAGAAVTVGELVARTDEDGLFRLTDVPTGQITLRAARDGLAGETQVNLRPGDEVVTLELRIE